MSTHFDYIVIGGGSAGYAAARTAREFTESVAIVDGGSELGGLCILRGCMPSKTLIYSAEVLHAAQKGASFGLNIPQADVDMTSLHKRKLATIGEFAEYRQEQLQSDRFTLFRNHARFTGENTISLDDGTTLTADHFLIATGSVVQFPPLPGLDSVPVWTSDDILDLDHVPESVIVLGGGIVACELAQFLKRIGTQVIQIQRSAHILKEASVSAAQVVEKAFTDEGIELFTDTKITNIAQVEDGVEVTFEQSGKTIRKTAKHLFNALGRKPNTASLDLEAAGVELKSSGHIDTDDNMQTSNSAIYAAGDVAGPHEIVHIAIMQGEIAAKHAFGKRTQPINYEALTSIIFTDPQIAYVGIPEKELQAKGIEYVTADYPFDDHGKSILMEAKYGYVKVFAEKSTGRVLAAECVGKDASELIHAMAVAVTMQSTVYELMKVHWYHPTLAEIWGYPIEDIADEISQLT